MGESGEELEYEQQECPKFSESPAELRGEDE